MLYSFKRSFQLGNKQFRVIYTLKEKRIALLACAYHAIRTEFKEKNDNFQGYEDLEEAD